MLKKRFKSLLTFVEVFYFKTGYFFLGYNSANRQNQFCAFVKTIIFRSCNKIF